MKRTLEEDSDDKGCSTPERVKGVTATTPKTADFNDFANTNPYPSCNAISIPRNGNIEDYFQYDF